MLALVSSVARHELVVLAKTKRVLMFALMYLGGAAVSALLYVLAVRAIEEQATSLLIEGGANADAAAGAVSTAGQKAFEQLVAFFAGGDAETVAKSLSSSVVLPPVLWGTLAFLPFIVVLMSFDMLASELGARTLTYASLRVPRRAILLGKLAAQAILFTSLTLLASLLLLLFAQAKLESFSLIDELPGLARLWILLIPYGLTYLGIAAFASASNKQPSLALFMALGIMFTLRLVGWFGSAPDEGAYALLRELRWLSPANYQTGFWRAGITEPLASAGAYLAFTLVFVSLAIKKLEARDL